MEFSLKRIGLLIRLQWIENQKFYAWAMLGIPVLMGAILIISSLIMPGGLTDENQGPIFIAGLFFSSWIFNSLVFGKYKSRPDNLKSLSLPASAAEKTACSLLFTLVLFPVFFCLVTYPMLLLIVYIDTELIGNINSLVEIRRDYVLISIAILIPLLLLNSVITLSVRKYAFFKALAILIAAFVTLNFLNGLIINTYLGNQVPGPSASSRAAFKDLELNNVQIQPGVSSSLFSQWSLELRANYPGYTGPSAWVKMPEYNEWLPVVLYYVLGLLLFRCVYLKIRETTI
ncbi:hypothetical protein C7T94_16495 [Pedobacter yulinensis]|uniref:Uncharacterized protein n=1 Tax=Pedobacter yulinensis TaxID=2126353 RepID=A0A2T3HIU8_9SPHI|nr:hypothetical protein [Pedobacter yulinensis]PST82375.1 hypothetical protein C7T94_16495 [Pedobacter yulinensis]